MKINPKLYHIALIAYCAGIFILSSVPGDEFPKVEFQFTDKIVHLVIYGIMCVLFFYSLKNQSKYVKLQKFSPEFALLFSVLFGLTDEFHQYFVPNRSCEFADWIADFAGAFIVYLLIRFYFLKNKKYIALLLLLTIAGCSSGNNSGSREKVRIGITEEDAWLNLMPVVGENQNIFGFLISVEFTNPEWGKNYSVKDFKIYLNNDTLLNKKYQVEIFEPDKEKVRINLTQLNDEMYLDKEKAEPLEARFVFSVYKDNTKLNTVNTSNLKIKKVY